MPVLVQICIVIATLALVFMTVASFVVLLRLNVVAQQLTNALHAWILQADELARESRGLLNEIRGLIPPTREAWTRLSRLGARIEGLSNVVLDELEGPVLTTVALLRSLQTGTSRFVELLMGRVMRDRTPRNGANQDE